MNDISKAIELLREVRDCDDSMYAYNPAYMEALDIAISTLKKQKPVKIDKEWDRYYGKNKPTCGVCGCYLGEYDKYCSRCGQAIDWGE